MSCERWRDVLLEAEPAELRGEGETELAEHVRGCSRCSALAQHVLDDIAALSSALTKQQSTVPVGAAVADATKEGLRRRQTHQRFWRAAIPALAAASLAGLLVTQRTTGRTTVQPLPEERQVSSFVPDVDAPGDRDYMVIGNDDSEIVIIWFF